VWDSVSTVSSAVLAFIQKMYPKDSLRQHGGSLVMIARETVFAERSFIFDTVYFMETLLYMSDFEL
jgi:hypothetical protein